MKSRDTKVQAAVALLRYHANTTPEILLLPEFYQVKQREVALLYVTMTEESDELAKDLYVSAITELHQTIESMSEQDIIALRGGRLKGFLNG